MAQSTVAEDIIRLEAKLSQIRTNITAQKNLSSVDEGNHSVVFTKLRDLYDIETEIQTKLDTLYRSL